MVKINYSELRMDHIVVFEQDNTIFVCAKENGKGSTRIFLIFDGGSGNVYTRNGQIDSWESLVAYDASVIRNRVEESRQSNILTYRINGSHN